MCYSARISLLAFTVGFGFSIALMFSRNTHTRLLGFFLGFVSWMQFIEYLLWMHQVCDDYNKHISVIGMILNHLQPVVLALLVGTFYGKNIPALLAIVLVYLAVCIPYSMQFTTDLQCSTTQCGNPHLVWNWNTMNYSDEVYLLFLASFAGIAVLGMPHPNGLTFAAVSVATYSASAIIYDRKVMGSLWCFWTAFFPPFLYLTQS